MGYYRQSLYSMVLGLGLDDSFDSSMLGVAQIFPYIVHPSAVVHVVSAIYIPSVVLRVHHDELTSSLLITTLQFIYATRAL